MRTARISLKRTEDSDGTRSTYSRQPPQIPLPAARAPTVLSLPQRTSPDAHNVPVECRDAGIASSWLAARTVRLHQWSEASCNLQKAGTLLLTFTSLLEIHSEPG